MKRVLIYKDNESIGQSKEFLARLVAYYQEIYDAFKEINIEVSILEIESLIANKENTLVKDLDISNDFVRSKIVENISEKQWQGITYLNKEKLKDLVDVPDTSSIRQLINSYQTIWSDKFRSIIRLALLEIKNGEVVKLTTADSQIEAFYTYYSNTEKGAAIAECLHCLCEKLNEWETLAATLNIPGHDLSKSIPCIETRHEADFKSWYDRMKGMIKDTFNIQKDNSNNKKQGRCYPSLSFIRSYEKI